MSRRRVYSPETLATMERFFTALQVCLDNKQIRNISYFCAHYGIDKRHLYAQRKERYRGFFEVSWLLPLVNDCAVSPLWLLTGKGTMFVQ